MPDRIVRYLYYKVHADRVTHRLFHRVNDHRGRFLILFGLLYGCFGWSYIVEGSSPSRRATFEWLPDVIPMSALSWPWFTAALIAVISAFRYTPPRTDRFGFMALALAPLVWACMFLFSYFAGYAPTGWISTIIYGGFAAIVILVSSWPNPVELDGRTLLDGAHD